MCVCVCVCERVSVCVYVYVCVCVNSTHDDGVFLSIQSELSLLLYPVFVHLYLNLVRGGHVSEGTP